MLTYRNVSQVRRFSELSSPQVVKLSWEVQLDDYDIHDVVQLRKTDSCFPEKFIAFSSPYEIFECESLYKTKEF